MKREGAHLPKLFIIIFSLSDNSHVIVLSFSAANFSAANFSAANFSAANFSAVACSESRNPLPNKPFLCFF
uniref:pentapeptide repeat-containing protein n=1 Tax=uncultured Dysgonomonas sp. TaxID=206096 RepID=UPI00338DC7FA